MLNERELEDLLFVILRDTIYCQDNQLFIRNELKYLFHNLLEVLNPEEMQRVYDEIEYKGEKEEDE
jgi:hypothetical protein